MAGRGLDAGDARTSLDLLLLFLMSELRLARLLGLHLRPDDEILPPRQHHDGEDDDHEQVAIVFFHGLSELETFRSALHRGEGAMRRRNGIEAFRAAEPFDRMAAREPARGECQ